MVGQPLKSGVGKDYVVAASITGGTGRAAVGRGREARPTTTIVDFAPHPVAAKEAGEGGSGTERRWLSSRVAAVGHHDVSDAIPDARRVGRVVERRHARGLGSGDHCRARVDTDEARARKGLEKKGRDVAGAAAEVDDARDGAGVATDNSRRRRPAEGADGAGNKVQGRLKTVRFELQITLRIPKHRAGHEARLPLAEMSHTGHTNVGRLSEDSQRARSSSFKVRVPPVPT